MSKLNLTGNYHIDLKELNHVYFRCKGSFTKFSILINVTSNPKHVLTLKELYQCYLNWCRENVSNPIGKNLFSERVHSELTSRVTLGKNITGFRGLQLSDDLDWFI